MVSSSSSAAGAAAAAKGGRGSWRRADTKSEFETVCDEVEAVSEKGLQNWTRHGLREPQAQSRRRGLESRSGTGLN